MSRIILAFDSFKECITAHEACEAARQGVLEALPDAEVIMLPMSDGGEGLVCCLAPYMNLELREIDAHDALMRPIKSRYALTADGTMAIMEMAATCGLELIAPEDRDVMRATTYGVGEMLLDAAGMGVQHIVIGIGGSATCDGGRGMMECLQQAPEGWPTDLHITVVCDVTTPLYGPDGAAYVFAPQKGATPEQVEMLDRRLREIARDAESRGADPSKVHYPGAGAAGGLGYGLMVGLGAELSSGTSTVLDLLGFKRHVIGADLIITGEGKSDHQTLYGKVPLGILFHTRSALYDRPEPMVPIHLCSGAIEEADALLRTGFASVCSINEGDNRPLATLLQPEVAKENLRQAVRRLVATHLAPH